MNNGENNAGGKLLTKRVVTILLTIFLVFGGISTVMVFFQVIPNELNVSANREPYAESFSLELNEGDDLILSLSGVDITVERYDGDTLTAEFNGSFNSDAVIKNKLVADRTGKLTTITQPNDSTSQFFSISINPDMTALRGTLLVLVPDIKLKSAEFKTFSGNISISDIASENIAIDTSFGNVVINKASAERGLIVDTFSGNLHMSSGTVSDKFSFDTSTGNIYCEDSLLKNAEINTFSGNVHMLTSAVSDGFFAKTSTGNIFLESSQLKTAKAETFSGNVRIKETALDDTDVSTSSGNIELTLTQHANIKSDTFSGNVDIAIPADMGFTFEFDTFAGDFDSGIPFTMGSTASGPDINGTVGDGNKHVFVSTSTGNLDLRTSR